MSLPFLAENARFADGDATAGIIEKEQWNVAYPISPVARVVAVRLGIEVVHHNYGERS